MVAKLEIVTLWSHRYLIAESLLVKTINRRHEKKFSFGISSFMTDSLRWPSGALSHPGWLPSQVFDIPNWETSEPAKNQLSMEVYSLLDIIVSILVGLRDIESLTYLVLGSPGLGDLHR